MVIMLSTTSLREILDFFQNFSEWFFFSIFFSADRKSWSKRMEKNPKVLCSVLILKCKKRTFEMQRWHPKHIVRYVVGKSAFTFHYFHLSPKVILSGSFEITSISLTAVKTQLKLTNESNNKSLYKCKTSRQKKGMIKISLSIKKATVQSQHKCTISAMSKVSYKE